MSEHTTSAEASVVDRLVNVTVWKSAAPREKFGGKTTLRKLAEKIETRSAARKEDLWWLKLATFGDKASDKGVLRHNENVEGIDGIEADYDGGEISFDRAVEIAEKAGLGCLIYTSPSHTPEAPRWRVLAPFTETMDPADHNHMIGRLAGLYDGIFAAESWTLSQSYYYGFITGKEATHRVEVIEGQGIDELDELDEVWRSKPLRSAKFHEKSSDAGFRRHVGEEPLDVEATLDAIRSGKSYHPACMSFAASCIGKGYTREETFSKIAEILDSVPPEQKNRRWRVRRSARHINSMLDWVSQKENRKLFSRLKEREAREDDARTAPEPEPAPDPEPDPNRDAEQPAESEKPADPSPGAEAPGGKKQTATNVMTLRRAWRRFPEMAGLVAFNELTFSPMLMKPIPDPDRKRNAPFEPRPWEDNDDIRLALWFQSIGYLKCTKLLAHDVMQLEAAANTFHPVKEYLAALKWDGVPRISEWLRRYAGAVIESEDQAAYIEAVSRAVLIGCVARADAPGCKLDTMLILEGPQGALKSSLIRTLCADPEWFSDTLPHDLSHKDARQALRGNWLIEMGEIAALRKSDVESLKSFLSTQVDKYRPSHGRNEVARRRQCVFFGTTNEDSYLIDATGNRRFWPVRIERIDLAGLAENRDQLWAEARDAYRAGEPWWLTGDVASYAMREQDERLVHDEWEAPIREYLNLHRGAVEVRFIMKEALSIEAAFQTRADQMRVTTSLKRLGYTARLIKISGKPCRCWVPPEGLW